MERTIAIGIITPGRSTPAAFQIPDTLLEDDQSVLEVVNGLDGSAGAHLVGLGPLVELGQQIGFIALRIDGAASLDGAGVPQWQPLAVKAGQAATLVPSGSSVWTFALMPK